MVYSMRNLKAQAAMEYLMTYGWAILIVVIVAAALFALGIFSPPTGSRCVGFANIGCPAEWQLDSGTDDLIVVLKNGAGQTINITTLNATIGGTTGQNTTAAGYSLGPGASTTIVFDNTFAGPGSGDSYSAQIELTYYLGSGTLDQKDTGTLSGAAL